MTKTLDVEKVREIEVTVVDMSKLSSAAKDLVRIASYLDWRLRNTRDGGVSVSSPVEPRVRFALPAGANLNEHRTAGWMAKLMKYSPPERLVALHVHVGLAEEADKEGSLSEHLLGAVKGDARVAQLTGALGDDYAIGFGEVESEPEPTVISERPWLAKRGSNEQGGRVYPSRTTIERKWSNGSMDYRCAKDGCDFTDPLPQRVASHYRASKDHEGVDPPKQDELLRTEPWEPGTHRDPTARVKRLALELVAVLGELSDEGAKFTSFDNADELAVAVARRMIEKRDRDRREEEEPADPLTPEQVLEKVRRLVDDGTYYKAIVRERELADELALLRIEAEQCRASAADALSAKQRIEADLATLRDLLANIGTETGK